MKIIKQRLLIPLLLPILLASCAEQETGPAGALPDAENAAQRTAELRQRLQELQARAERVEDSNDIKRLQRAFGYYMDEGLWDEVVDLFSENATLEMARDGVYSGRERIREYFYALGNGRQGLAEGQLNEHFQLMPVVTLGEDGRSARARWRAIILKGEYGEGAWWGEGPYENEYVKEDGVWKISRLHWFQTIYVPYEGGWAANEDVNRGIWVSDELPPDAPSTYDFKWWPETFLPPFHFDNPVKRYEGEGSAQ